MTGRHLTTSQMPDLDFLREEKLNRSSTFRELRSQVEHHFAKDQGAMHPEKSPRWRSVLYNSLLTCLREVAFTTDGKEQAEMLRRVHKWYLRKTNRAFSAPRVARPVPVLETLSYSFAKSGFAPTPLKIPVERSESPVKSPVTPLSVREKDSQRAFMRPQMPAVVNEARIMSRLQDYQHRKLKEIRSILVEKRQVEQWTLKKSRLEADSSFFTEQMSRHSPLDSQIRDLSPSTLQSRPTNVSPGPILVDFRSDYAPYKGNSAVNAASADAKVAQFRQKHCKLLQLSEESEGKRQFSGSLAFYRREETVEVERPRTPAHSDMNQTPVQVKIELSRSLSPLRKAKLEELVAVKRKLALANLPCTYRQLTNGLMEPGDLPAHMLTPQSLPQGGELLHSNPFFNSGKPKKRKSKRKH